MKKLILTFTLVCVVVISVFGQNKPKQITKKPILKFEETTIDYGIIEKGSDPVRYFNFTNTGKSPLVILSAHGSCGCTVPTWPKDSIAPGQKSRIKVHYDTQRLGAFSKSVTIISNATEPSKILKIKGTVILKKDKPNQKKGKN